MKINWHVKKIFLVIIGWMLFPIVLKAQSFTEILGRPTNNSITFNVLFDQSVECYWEYGTISTKYSLQTQTVVAKKDTTFENEISNLLPNTRYFYRIRYRKFGSNVVFTAGKEHYFFTQRAKGSSFKFTIESDPHPYDKKGSHTLLYIALKNQLADSADFLFDLGDTFGDDHNPFTITSSELGQLHLDWRDYFGTVCHSSPLFLCLGNHEGESGFYLSQTPPNNLAVMATNWRKFYYSNPVPNNFYSGNNTIENFGVGLPQNYYSWEWGDALFVVLDVYRYATASASPGMWDWTLGEKQYNWFKQTLENSTAKFKFVFAHHVRGYGRGAALLAKYFEWGGYESDGTTWGFTAKRPGWSLPIHQLMVKNGVNIFFQGHDHLFAKEELDGIIYQEVPMPSDSTYIIGTRDHSDAYTDVKIDASGHLRVTVSPEKTTVDYIRAWLPADETAQNKNRELAYSYTVFPKITSLGTNNIFPLNFSLEQNYPNPFNPTTTIRYQIPDNSFVTIKIYDVFGREIESLVNEQKDKGAHSVLWNAINFPSGIYFYKLNVGDNILTKKGILIK